MKVNRRSLLAISAVRLLPAAATRRIRLGGPIFLKSDDPDKLAREHRRLGYSAAYCPEAGAQDSARLRAIEKAFATQDVVIAEVGAWVNMLDADPEKRKKNLTYVAERLALGDAVGARCCVDIAGSRNPEKWDGPDPRNFSRDFFDATVENCRRVIDEVRPRRTKFSIEMMGWMWPEGPDQYLQLMRAIDRRQFGVHIDVCNGLNSAHRFYNNAAYIRETFAKLGRWILSCHAKDLAWLPEPNLHFVEVIPGRGSLDYAAYLSEIAKLPAQAPLMLEHLKTPAEYEEGKRHILKVGADLGLEFA